MVNLRLVYLFLRLLQNKIHPMDPQPGFGPGPPLVFPDGNQYQVLPASQVGSVIVGLEVLSKVVSILLARKFPPKSMIKVIAAHLIANIIATLANSINTISGNIPREIIAS